MSAFVCDDPNCPYKAEVERLRGSIEELVNIAGTVPGVQAIARQALEKK